MLKCQILKENSLKIFYRRSNLELQVFCVTDLFKPLFPAPDKINQFIRYSYIQFPLCKGMVKILRQCVKIDWV